MPWLGLRDTLVPVAVYLGEPPALVDGCDVLELSWSWAAGSDSGVTTTADAGSGRLRLYDPDRVYDPLTPTTSPAAIGTPVRILVAGVPAFRGRIDAATHDLDVASLTIVDDVAALAAVSFVETSVPAEVSSARISRILDLAAWPTDRRDVAAGGVPLQAGTVAADAWSELVEVARNELGAVWLTPGGVVTFRPRAAAWGGSGAVLANLGCPPSLAYLTDLTLTADAGDLVNVLAAARRTGTQKTISDAASISKYRPRSHVQNDLELATDGDRDLWSAFYLVRSRSPLQGVGSIVARPGASAIATLLGLPFGGIVHIADQGHGPDVDRRARWLGTRWLAAPGYVEVSATLGQDQSIGPVDRALTIDTGAEWLTYQVTPAPTNVTAREPGLQLTYIPQRPAGT